MSLIDEKKPQIARKNDPVFFAPEKFKNILSEFVAKNLRECKIFS